MSESAARHLALGLGIAGAIPLAAMGLAASSASWGARGELALIFLGLAGALFVARRALPPLAASFVAPRHALLALALLALSAGLGVPGAAVGSLFSLAWAWRHRGALVTSASPRARALLWVAAAVTGVPLALWAAPVVLDGPAIVEDPISRDALHGSDCS